MNCFQQKIESNFPKFNFFRSEQRRRYGHVDSKTHLTTFDQDSVVTVDDAGTVRLWEVNQSKIAKSLTVWQSSVGGNPISNLQNVSF